MRFRRKKALVGLDGDIRDHLDRAIEEHINRGLAPQEARRRALIAFGSVALAKEDTRAVWTGVWLDQMIQDAAYACRTFLRNPTFALVAVLTLAVGISVTTGVFSVVSAVLLRPLPFKHADRLVRIVENVPAAESLRGRAARTPAMTEDEFIWWRTHSRTLQMAVTMPESRTMRTPDGTVRLAGARVSSNWFDMYGVQPVLGRALRPEEEQQGSLAIVLSMATWRRYFGSDPQVLERSVLMDGDSYTVVGVMASADRSETAFWRPYAPEPPRRGATTFVGVTSQLLDGVSFEAAATEIDLLGRQVRGMPREQGVVPRFEIVRVQDQMVARVRPALQILTVAVGIVLLVVCANVANLLLARGSSREREFSVRRALGAARSRIVRQLLTESVLLSAAGGALGIAVAAGGVHFMKPLAVYGLPEQFRSALGPSFFDIGVFPRIDEVTIDARVLIFVVVTVVFTGILFGLAPAIRLSRVEHVPALAHARAAQSDRPGPRPSRLRHMLAISQLALATMLLVVTGLLVHSFVKLSNVDIGFDPRVLVFELVLPQDYTPVRRLAIANELSEQLRSLPAVTAVGFTDRPPLSRMNASWTGPVAPLDREWQRMDPADRALIRTISPDYLRALGADLLAGSWVGERSGDDATILVNRAYVRRFFGTKNPIGEMLRWGTVGTYRIVGVVSDMHWSLPESPDSEPHPAVFMEPRVREKGGSGPPEPAPSFAVRASVDPLSLVRDVRRIAAEIDQGLAIDGMTTLDRVLAGLETRPRFYALLMSFFGAAAGFIAAIGVYGVLAYGVMERTHEIGVRVALGARPVDILRLVLGQAAVLVAFGIALGLAGAAGLTRYLTAMLFGVTALDGPTYVLVSTAFAVLAMAASYVPARRAMKVSPLVALKYE